MYSNVEKIISFGSVQHDQLMLKYETDIIFKSYFKYICISY